MLLILLLLLLNVLSMYIVSGGLDSYQGRYATM
jgi:hypothetical protein